jgi:hypothetical protein
MQENYDYAAGRSGSFDPRIGRCRKAVKFVCLRQHAIAVCLFDTAEWRTMLDDALRQTEGP